MYVCMYPRGAAESGGGTWFPSCLDESSKLKVWGLALRLLLVLFTTVLAIVIPHFSLLMGLIGSFTGKGPSNVVVVLVVVWWW